MACAQAKKPETGRVKPGEVHFEDLAQQAGLSALNVYGGDTHKEFIIETTGNGAIIFDYDNDGWPDVFLPNGSTVEGFPKIKRRPDTCITTIATVHSPM